MGLSMGLSLGMSVEQRLEVKLSPRQRLEVLNYEQIIWQDFLKSIRDERYRPNAVCKCGYQLQDAEIIKGFSTDPTDFETTCPKCGYRFRPNLSVTDEYGNVRRLYFYCADQTLALIEGRERYAPDDRHAFESSVYRSAVYHFGSLCGAFAELGIKYRYDEMSEWRDKIEDFLGRLPDKKIAGAIGKPVRLVSRLRRSLGIERYTKQTALEELRQLSEEGTQ